MRSVLPMFLLACSDAAEIGDTGSWGACADTPPVNYTNFGEGFLTENCQGCHASTSPNRYGAPEGIVFDTVEQAWAWRESILYLVVDEGEPAMPPAGGISEDDRQRLSWWFACAEEST